jgi:hypothetical protein
VSSCMDGLDFARCFDVFLAGGAVMYSGYLCDTNDRVPRCVSQDEVPIILACFDAR